MTVTTPRPAAAPTAVTLPGSPAGLNHAAFVTHDTVAVADFYERVLGMQLVQAILDDRIPSTGEAVPYFHSFFRMQDGSTIAFFEAPELPRRGPDPHPAYGTFEHFAMGVASKAEVEEWATWLRANDVDVLGPVDHKIIYSIYFHDPSGLRLEITTATSPDWNDNSTAAHAALAEWQAVKEHAAVEGIPLTEAVEALTKARSHQRGLDVEA